MSLINNHLSSQRSRKMTRAHLITRYNTAHRHVARHVRLLTGTRKPGDTTPDALTKFNVGPLSRLRSDQTSRTTSPNTVMVFPLRASCMAPCLPESVDYARWNLRAAGRKPATHPTSVQRPADYSHGFHTRSTPTQIDDMCGNQFHPQKAARWGSESCRHLLRCFRPSPNGQCI